MWAQLWACEGWLCKPCVLITCSLNHAEQEKELVYSHVGMVPTLVGVHVCAYKSLLNCPVVALQTLLYTCTLATFCFSLLLCNKCLCNWQVRQSNTVNTRVQWGSYSSFRWKEGSQPPTLKLMVLKSLPSPHTVSGPVTWQSGSCSPCSRLFARVWKTQEKALSFSVVLYKKKAHKEVKIKFWPILTSFL